LDLRSYLPSGLGKVLLQLLRDRGVNVALGLRPSDPAVLQGGLAGQPVVNIDAHQGPDEVLRLLADVVPVGGVELKLSCEKVSGSSFPGWKKRGDKTFKKKFLSVGVGGQITHLVKTRTFQYLSKEVCIVFIVERRIAAEQDV